MEEVVELPPFSSPIGVHILKDDVASALELIDQELRAVDLALAKIKCRRREVLLAYRRLLRPSLTNGTS